MLGPVFFEFIQREGDDRDGFGEGNFAVLLESLSATRSAVALAAEAGLTPNGGNSWPLNAYFYGAMSAHRARFAIRAGADYTCAQNYAAYTEADHDTYRRLYERQSWLLPGLASQAFIDALPSWASATGFRASMK